MLGSMITRIREDKGITKLLLSKKIGIHIGHLIHIEKGERTPSHKLLRKICETLNVPYKNLLDMYEKELDNNKNKYNILEHIPYTKVLAVEKFDTLIDCPYTENDISMAYKVPDDSMEPILKKGEYAFLELNSAQMNRCIGLFLINGNYMLRRLSVKKDSFVFRAENEKYPEIELPKESDFSVIGKVILK